MSEEKKGNLSTEDDDDDLLKILTDSSKEDEEENSSVVDTDEEDANRKMEEIRSLAETFGNSEVIGKNPGSGDIDTDLSNWFEGSDSLPSDKLNGYVSNSEAKMSYGLSRNALSSYQMMGKLGKFLDSSLDMLFSDQAIMGLSPEDILDRVKVGFAMYKELGSLNQKTYMALKDYKLKSGSSSDDTDKLTMLLSSIPSDKLEEILMELNRSKSK